jgi:hypothetical protein
LLQIDIGWESIEEPEIYMDAQVFDNNIPGEQEDEQRRAGLLNAPDLEEPYHEREEDPDLVGKALKNLRLLWMHRF